MGTMTVLPRGRPMTRDDLDAMPDDGHRYELVDGTLVVTPAPRRIHQRASAKLHLLLAAACPAELEVLFAPFDVAISDSTVLQPDLLVAPVVDFTDRDLPVAPLLAVEVLSPSTRLIDLTLKRESYEKAGCPSYWVVDPDTPSLTAWQLADDRYVEVAHVVCDAPFVATAPFRVTVVPDALIQR